MAGLSRVQKKKKRVKVVKKQRNSEEVRDQQGQGGGKRYRLEGYAVKELGEEVGKFEMASQGKRSTVRLG